MRHTLGLHTAAFRGDKSGGPAVRRGQIAEPIRVHTTDRAQTPLEFSWRGRRHQVRRVLRLVERDRYQLRTRSGMRCQIARGPGYWLLERVLSS